jgi:hypothetical protein
LMVETDEQKRGTLERLLAEERATLGAAQTRERKKKAIACLPLLRDWAQSRLSMPRRIAGAAASA